MNPKESSGKYHNRELQSRTKKEHRESLPETKSWRAQVGQQQSCRSHQQRHRQPAPLQTQACPLLFHPLTYPSLFLLSSFAIIRERRKREFSVLSYSWRKNKFVKCWKNRIETSLWDWFLYAIDKVWSQRKPTLWLDSLKSQYIIGLLTGLQARPCKVSVW